MTYLMKQRWPRVPLLIFCSALTLAAQENRSQLPTRVEAARKPNIVLMLTDNLGYGELGVYGGGILRGAPTPRIDKFATEACGC